ncbi:MAG: metallophosphoesterase family protein [Acidobacteria bacterium]|nr:metallophosphoesterase family protein [Acidobacteriota bacterium]
MRIIAISDVHDDLTKLTLLAQREAGADLLLVSGDLTHYGGMTRFRETMGAFDGVFPRVLAVPGNMDRPEVTGVLEEGGTGLHGRHEIIGDVGFAGIGASPPTPFGTPFELSEEEIGEAFAAAAARVAACPVRVFVSHAPPRGTALDRVRLGLHVGSRAVRAVVERFAPDVLVCGHIHEAAGTDRLGRTQMVNPGPFARGGYVRILTGPPVTAEWCRL